MDAGSLTTIPISYIISIVLLIFGGAYFAAAETSLASVNRIRMISDAEDGNKKARKVLYILDNFDNALTTMLIGNNVMHIACSSVATLLASKLWGNTGVTIMTFIITFIVFIFAEMIPKSYAKACSEKLAPIIAPSLIFFMYLLKPISYVFTAVTNLITRLFPAAEDEDLTVTEEEFNDIIENIDEEDEIDEETTELLQSVLEYTATTAKDIIKPWGIVSYLSDSMSDEEMYQAIENSRFSRLPVIDSEGNIKGVLHIRKLLKAKVRGNKMLKQASMLDKPYYVPASMPLDDLLPELSSHRTHMAFVKDEDGQVLGLITVENILEELVGDIHDEKEVSQ